MFFIHVNTLLKQLLEFCSVKLKVWRKVAKNITKTKGWYNDNNNKSITCL